MKFHAGHARALINLFDENIQLQILSKIIKDELISQES